MTTTATTKRRLDKLESWQPIPPLADVIGPHAEFCMRVFENVCVECSDRVMYPRCPSSECATLIKGFDDKIATSDANEQQDRALIEGVRAWREKRNRSEWLKGGFFLFAYEDEQAAIR